MPEAIGFPIEPPIEPMLSKLATGLPEGDGGLFGPKWDGFRAIVFRDREGGCSCERKWDGCRPIVFRDRERVYLQSRDLRPFDRYFPELKDRLVASLPE